MSNLYKIISARPAAGQKVPTKISPEFTRRIDSRLLDAYKEAGDRADFCHLLAKISTTEGTHLRDLLWLYVRDSRPKEAIIPAMENAFAPPSRATITAGPENTAARRVIQSLTPVSKESVKKSLDSALYEFALLGFLSFPKGSEYSPLIHGHPQYTALEGPFKQTTDKNFRLAVTALRAVQRANTGVAHPMLGTSCETAIELFLGKKPQAGRGRQKVTKDTSADCLFAEAMVALVGSDKSPCKTILDNRTLAASLKSKGEDPLSLFSRVENRSYLETALP
jgi:hypothetical protein